VTGVGFWLDKVTRQERIVAEVVYPPFAYALSFNGTDIYPAGEITHWTRAEHGAVTQESCRLPFGFCYTPFFGDFRTAAKIEHDRKVNLESG
jgi:hypothetical protein